MSWGDGKYMDYCFKMQDEMKRLKLNKQEKMHFLAKKYKYVSTVCNVDSKESFFESCGVKIPEKEE